MSAMPLDTRRSGVLLHISSLASRFGNGDLGHEAFRFVDFLAAAGSSVWQMLPLGPTHQDLSPYNALSVHAGNPRFISIDWLLDHGFTDQGNADRVASGQQSRQQLLDDASERFAAALKADSALADDFSAFQKSNSWLDDFTLFVAIREHLGFAGWSHWPAPLRDRDSGALAEQRSALAARIAAVAFEQYCFARQWTQLRRYANERGVLLFGDIPIFVSYDSADVWANREQFKLDSAGEPTVVAGVPPDYFAVDGQRWGNPHYDWEQMAADGFAWWRSRMRSQCHLFDLIRIDHFRGFEACWEIPADAPTARDGQWVPGPGDALLNVLREQAGDGVLVAEDLGIITDEVSALRERHGMPGMLILQFAFDGDPANAYLPHNHSPLSVVYTGTHDNDTTQGWFDQLDDGARSAIYEYLGRSAEPMPWALIRAALGSVSRLAVVPFQDLLGMGSEHRMNTPGVAEGNWGWQMGPGAASEELAAHLRHLNGLYGRLTSPG